METTETTEPVATVLDMKFDGAADSQLVSGSHLFAELDGTVNVDGEEWPAYLLLFASKEPAVPSGKSMVAMGEQYRFSIDKGLNKRPGEDWSFTMVTFASPFSELVIDSPKGEAEVVPCTPATTT